MSRPAWLDETSAGLRLRIHAQPGAKRTAVAGIHGDALKIRIQAAPVDGKANAALLGFLAKTLQCSPSQLVLLKGEHSRRKLIGVNGLTSEVAITFLDDSGIP